jgi:hypothetical protein
MGFMKSDRHGQYGMAKRDYADHFWDVKKHFFIFEGLLGTLASGPNGVPN